MLENRSAGVVMHLTSLPGPFGCGDIGDAAGKFLRVLSDMKLKVWQVLPAGPTAYGDSPYQPLSAFAGNEMLVGIDPLIRAGLLRGDETAVLESLPASHVDYGRLIPGKRTLLNTAATRFDATADSGLKADYDEFIHRNDSQWLHDYALFRVIKSLHDERPWSQWDQEYLLREQTALDRIGIQHADAIKRLKIIQFLFHQQWQVLRQCARKNDIRLFGDIPIYIALDSSDAWANPELLLIDQQGQPSHVAGVPPDYFSEDGQLWGNPLYDWPYHEQSGFQWWKDRMQHAGQLFDMVRIDHFRGFESYWSVPAGQDTARDGRWEPAPGDALLKALQAAPGNPVMIAEDLGVITDEVNELRSRHGIPGMKVLQFEVDDPEFNPEEIPEECACYTGTHDNDTTLGWFRGSPNDVRDSDDIQQTQQNALGFTAGSADSIHEDMIRLAFDSRASLAVAPMQDFLGLGSEARMNIPGTTINNWRWRMASDEPDEELSSRVAAMVLASARG
ncbi:MAG: 4-alpha-glucanotransferase [Xanthomonadales bacterium]|nr:4-alpha-glucanotransferase [Xanthomonadales bacterium]